MVSAIVFDEKPAPIAVAEFRQIIPDAEARGGLLGLTRNSGPAEIAQAASEDVGYQTRELLEAMLLGANNFALITCGAREQWLTG